MKISVSNIVMGICVLICLGFLFKGNDNLIQMQNEITKKELKIDSINYHSDSLSSVNDSLTVQIKTISHINDSLKNSVKVKKVKIKKQKRKKNEIKDIIRNSDIESIIDLLSDYKFETNNPK